MNKGTEGLHYVLIIVVVTGSHIAVHAAMFSSTAATIRTEWLVYSTGCWPFLPCYLSLPSLYWALHSSHVCYIERLSSLCPSLIAQQQEELLALHCRCPCFALFPGVHSFTRETDTRHSFPQLLHVPVVDFEMCGLPSARFKASAGCTGLPSLGLLGNWDYRHIEGRFCSF